MKKGSQIVAYYLSDVSWVGGGCGKGKIQQLQCTRQLIVDSTHIQIEGAERSTIFVLAAPVALLAAVLNLHHLPSVRDGLEALRSWEGGDCFILKV